jgi:hypothetical protein
MLDEIECVEEYRPLPGGFHPISIGDKSSGGRYKVIHKLGFGGFSTVWLACDREREPGTLVTLKAMVADASSKFPAQLGSYYPPRHHWQLPDCQGQFSG